MDVLAVDNALWCIVFPGEEEGEDSLRDEASVIGAPNHGGKGFGSGFVSNGIFGVEDGSLSGGEISRVESACQKCPIRCSRASREP